MAINTGPTFGGRQNNAGGMRTTNATGRQTQTQNGPAGMAPAGPTPHKAGFGSRLMGASNRAAMAPINPLIHPIASARSFGNALLHPPGAGALGHALGFGGGGFQNLPAGNPNAPQINPRPMPPSMAGSPMMGPPAMGGAPNMPNAPSPMPPIAAGAGGPMMQGGGNTGITGGMGPLFNRYNQMSAGVPGRQLVY